MKEIERKWLLESLPTIDKVELITKCEITQSYISIKPEIRLRKTLGIVSRKTHYTLTIKTDGDMTREEIELNLDSSGYDNLTQYNTGKVIRKLRYFVKLRGTQIEIDVYKGDLKGLIVAEVEFGNEEAAKRYEAPDWFGREVTEDSSYKNKSLALS